MGDREAGPGASHGRGFDFRWVDAAPGRLALWHRPKLKAIPHLRGAGCTRLVTLLGEHEGGADIGQMAEAHGLGWVWIPLPSGRPPEGRLDRLAREGVVAVSALLDQGESVLIHCSAGIHRTGMIAYAVLRSRGLDGDGALELIHEARPLTRQWLTPAHLAWGDRRS